MTNGWTEYVDWLSEFISCPLCAYHVHYLVFDLATCIPVKMASWCHSSDQKIKSCIGKTDHQQLLFSCCEYSVASIESSLAIKIGG